MPLKLNVGISKKVGLPAYSSLGASCHVEVELDQSLLFDNPERFGQRVEQVYTACRDAVANELARQKDPGTAELPNSHAASSVASDSPSNGHNGHCASQKQINFLEQLADQIRGLGVGRLEDLAEQMFGASVADLSTLDASGLIDLLKSVKSGKVDLNSVLDGPAT